MLVMGLIFSAMGSPRSLAQSAKNGDIVDGKQLFWSTDWSATGLTCAHCHADFNEKKDPDDRLRPGHSLYNGGFRAEWQTWDGRKIQTLKKAVEMCIVRWIVAREGEEEDKLPAKHHLRKVLAYLRSDDLSPEKKSRAIEPMRTNKLPSDQLLELGDLNLGMPIFRRSCSHCHLDDGSGPAPSLIRNGYSRYQIAKKVRGIDNPGLEGLVMPPFSKDRISDRELINIVAFIYQM